MSVVKWRNELHQLTSYDFRQSPELVDAGRAQYVRSSSGLVTIVLMTLFRMWKPLYISSANPATDGLSCEQYFRLDSYSNFRWLWAWP